MVAPVGRSSVNDIQTPAADTATPIVHPIASRTPRRSEKSIAATDGTIRNEKTRSTPAMATELVTTTPKDA